MHDARMVNTFRLYVDPIQFAFSSAGQAFPLRAYLQCPFRHAVQPRQIEKFNASISTVLTNVE